MILIVEGMDNSGKSSLIERLKLARFGSVVRKLTQGTPPTTAMTYEYCDELVDTAEDFALGIDTTPIIFDRHSLVSEMVYGPTLRGGSVISDAQWKAYWSWVPPGVVTTIYCRPPDGRVLDFGDRFQADGVRERASALLDAYDRFFAFDYQAVASKAALIHYDWTRDPEATHIINRLQTDNRW